MSRRYNTPPGTYDMPFTWCYDASGLTNGLAYPNQYVYLQGGYGDFILRRIVGLSRILNPTTGQYQIRDNDNNYIEQVPLFGVSADDLGIAPELRYQELGAIKFDLGVIDLPALTATSQIAFQGARRMKGLWSKRPGYKATPKTYTYVVPANITGVQGSAPTRVSQTMDDYDFELYNIILERQSNASLLVTELENPCELLFTAVTPGSSPITIDVENTGAPNTPPSVTVVGTAITMQAGTNSFGFPQPGESEGNFMAALYNANPAAVALATLQVTGGLNSIPTTGGPTPMGPASEGPLTGPISSLWLYDSNKVQVSSAPVLDVFMDGGQKATFANPTGALYGNGAISPPLFYPQETVINIDVYSQITDPTLLPTGLIIHLVGRKYYPC